MEEIVNRIRALCRSKNTSITKIEEELHFANGTIGKWKNGKKTPPLEKVILIAERLGTTPEYILRGEQKEKAPTGTGERMSDDELKVALFGSLDIDNADLDDVKRYAAFVRDKKRGK